MENNMSHINIPMVEILKVFKDYKEIHGTSPSPETKLHFQINKVGMNDVNLQEIIRQYQFPLYSPNSYNDSLVELIKKGQNYNSSLLYDAGIYRRYQRVILEYLENIPETTLQIGPGGSLGCEVLLILMGIKKACTLDLYPLMNFDLDKFMNSLKTIFEVISCFKDTQGFDPSGLHLPPHQAVNGCYRIGDGMVQHFYPRKFEDTGLEDESIDFLFSHATLEHVRDPLQCIQETWRLLRPGGLTAHCIDLRDHRNFNKPLEFLRWSPEAWERIMEKYCHQDGSIYLNRWRAPEFKAAFEREGFSVLEYVAEQKVSDVQLDVEMNCFHRDYRQFSPEDLATIGVFMVARKN